MGDVYYFLISGYFALRMSSIFSPIKLNSALIATSYGGPKTWVFKRLNALKNSDLL